PGWWMGQRLTRAGQCQRLRGHGLRAPLEKAAPKEPTEDFHGQEEIGGAWHPAGAVWSAASTWNDTVEVRMVLQLLAPGVQDRQKADVRAEMRRLSGHGQEGFRDGAKEEGVEEPWVLESQCIQRIGEGKHHVEIGHVEHLPLPVRQ